MKLDEMELDILELMYEKGELGYINGAHSEAAQVLNAKYISEREQQALMVTVQYLLEARYLWPYFDNNTEIELRNYARGITPKGVRRMRKLQRRFPWIRENWFPVLVAAITATLALADIVVNVIVELLKG